MYAQFISTDYIFKWTIIPDDVDADLITNFIREAQDDNIQTVLGYSLWEKLMNDYATTQTTTGQYLTLMNDYVMPALSKWTVYRAFPFIWARISNKSIVLKESDNSNPVTSSDRKDLEAKLLSTAEFYTQRIREYIMNNPSSFPEYFSITGVERIKPKAVNYFGGIYTSPIGIGGRRPPGYGDPSCCEGY